MGNLRNISHKRIRACPRFRYAFKLARSPEYRRWVLPLRTAIPKAFFCPTSTSSLLPRVTRMPTHDQKSSMSGMDVNEILVGAESSTEWIPPKYTAFCPYR